MAYFTNVCPMCGNEIALADWEIFLKIFRDRTGEYSFACKICRHRAKFRVDKKGCELLISLGLKNYTYTAEHPPIEEEDVEAFVSQLGDLEEHIDEEHLADP
jgi:hypothetical protein